MTTARTTVRVAAVTAAVLTVAAAPLHRSSAQQSALVNRGAVFAAKKEMLWLKSNPTPN
jgi:hypothetical protein